MNGKEVFKFAVGAMCEACNNVLEQAGVSADKVDWLLPHQANIRIISSVGQKLDIPTEKVIVTVDHHGNTSAASIPLALSESVENGRIKKAFGTDSGYGCRFYLGRTFGKVLIII